MGFFVKKSEYDSVVRANNEMRVKMEKLRLENALLKDQIRVLVLLPRELSQIYVFMQLKESVTAKDIANSRYFKGVKESKIKEYVNELIKRGLVGKRKMKGENFYGIETPDLAEVWAPKGKGTESSKPEPELPKLKFK
jgi:hypothetical protein